MRRSGYESRVMAASFAQWLKKCLGRRCAETVKQQGDIDPAPGRGHQRIADPARCLVLGEYVEAHIEL